MSYPSDAHSDTKIEIIQFDSAFSTYLDYWSIYSNFWIEVLNLYDCAGDLTCGASLCLSFYLVKEFISFPNPLAQPGQSKSHLKNKHFVAWFDCKCNYWLSNFNTWTCYQLTVIFANEYFFRKLLGIYYIQIFLNTEMQIVIQLGKVVVSIGTHVQTTDSSFQEDIHAKLCYSSEWWH